jgi:hypothetical protein
VNFPFDGGIFNRHDLFEARLVLKVLAMVGFMVWKILVIWIALAESKTFIDESPTLESSHNSVHNAVAHHMFNNLGIIKKNEGFHNRA